MDPHLRHSLQQLLPVAVPDTCNEAELLEALIQRINQLLNEDFQALVQLLYRLDIPEQKLKDLLRTHPDTDAARIIAALIVERQQQKLASRNQYRQNNAAGTDEEKW